MKILRIYLIGLCFIGLQHISNAAINYKALARKWAPFVKLAKGDPWRPSSVDFFLKNSKLVKSSGGQINTLTTSNLLTCDSNCYIRTKAKMKSADTNNLKVFYGENPAKVPVYAFVKQSADEIRLHYAFYYPYNRGKKICIGYQVSKWCPCPKIFGKCTCPRITKCVGVRKRFGNHVGDWENIDVYLNKDGSAPKFINMKAHGKSNIFTWNGKSFKNKDGKAIKFYSGHPVIYSAYGSHGSRYSAGKFVYKKVAGNNELTDETSDGGIKWKTWKLVKTIVVKTDGSLYHGDEKWVNFKGRWGNKKRDCGIWEKLSDQCVLNNGPTGPLKKISKND